MLALDARFATSFTAGLLAAVNPCGFVLLPTYLLYFLGMENLRPGAERTSVASWWATVTSRHVSSSA